MAQLGVAACIPRTDGQRPVSASANLDLALVVLMPDSFPFFETAIESGAVALTFAVGIWAIAQRRVAMRLRRRLSVSSARTRTAVGERDALLAAGREALVVWGRDGSGPFAFGGADAMLDSCIEGPDAAQLSYSLDELSAKGTSFALMARGKSGRKFLTRGRAVGGMAAVWLEEQSAQATGQTDFRQILDALPLPVWLRDHSLSLSWANRAFLDATGETDLEQARAHKATLDRSERDLAGAARAQGSVIETNRFAVIQGERRALNLTHIPLDDGEIVGSAVDITDISVAEARLQQHIDAHADTLDKLATAVAIFDRDQKLTFHNHAFAELWSLTESWLNRHPTCGELLDRLREMRRLPEKRDYLAWKQQYLAFFDRAPDFPFEELWHVPNGMTLRVVAQPHPFGGLTFLYEDVTEKLALESSYNTLAKAQSATLDTLQEGVAVFGLDGRLKLFNAAFARLLELSEHDVSGEPHIRRIVGNLSNKFGQTTQWEQLISDVLSTSQGRRDWGNIERSDHIVLSIALSSLPDGATLVTFSNVTDRFRVESALRDRNEALEAADRLKSEFIKHVSYELRTPLNTIVGFAEHLASELPGSLSVRQQEYMQAIVSASNTLHSLVNDILDLALIESGALRLELEYIDLYVLLSDIAMHARDWAAKVNLKLDLVCAVDVGQFWADSRRVRQIVFNLLSNSFKYTPRGGMITLTGTISDDVVISVADTGPGIAPELKANVFERFASKNRSGQRAGAGLGLALVDRFVQLHEGWVEIESKPNEGTTIRCHFPRRAENDQLTGTHNREIHAAE